METDILEQIKNDASQVIKEVIEKAKLKKGQLFIIAIAFTIDRLPLQELQGH